MTSDDLISREEALVGLPARRANTLLFLIENRTAQLVARSRVEFSLTESTEQERTVAFLEAFAVGNRLPVYLSRQHLERYAPEWAALVPENPRLKAALFHAISQKYNFTYKMIPNIRVALDLDEEIVQQAFQRQYRKPLDSGFAPRLCLMEKLSWSASAITQKIEALPPLWIAFLVTVALGLPQAFLALPVAVAQIGPLASLVLLITLGIINILTMACMAEAISRSGDFRYGNAFIKQLAGNYLGEAGSFILSLAVGIRVFLIALACYIGLSVTMAKFTPIPAQLWAALLFFAGLYLLSSKSINLTVTVTVLLAAINVSLLLILILLAFCHLQLENLLYINLPFLNGRPFAPLMLHQVFGVILMLYFGHVYVGECAKLVLPRDPSAVSLIWDSVAGTVFLTILFCLWVLTINGAIAPEILVTQSGTALEPLAQQLGPSAKVLGVILVTLLLGMAWIRSSSLLVNLAKEWSPRKPHSVLILPCQQGRLILQPHGNSRNFFRIGITYLGISNNQPKFRLDIQIDGQVHHIQINFDQQWQIQELFHQFPRLKEHDVHLTLETQSANQKNVYLKITSSMNIAYEGILPTTHLENASTQRTNYQHSFWLTLLKKHHFLLSINPLIIIFLVTEGLLLTKTQSFTSILSFAGVLGNSLVSGIFPVLLLFSSRQKGELVPNVVFKILNRPLLLASIYGFFLVILFMHGLFIWVNPIARISAICVGILSLVTTLIMQCTGAFTPRTIIEMREEQRVEGQTVFSITSAGKPKTTKMCLGYAEGEKYYQAATVKISSPSTLQYATFQVPTKQMEELRIWAYRGKSNGDFESLPAFLEVYEKNKIMQFDLKLSGGQVLLTASDQECYLKILLSKALLKPAK
jgi:hypothetical protein